MATTSPDRIVTLDVIRGIAVMGIFSVNVVAFAMIESAYFNPAVYGFDGLSDRLMWLANFILVDGKMRSLFSMLFGASMLVVTDRAEASGESPEAVHYRRMAVLLMFGLAHFYFVWFGDILTSYAVVGCVIFLFRGLSVPALAAVALVAYILAFVFASGDAAGLAAHVAAAKASGNPDAVGYFAPTAATIQRDLAVHSSWPAFVANMLGQRLWTPLNIVSDLFLETFALMLVGMTAYRAGFLSGEWTAGAYRKVAAIGIAFGGLLCAALAAWVWIDGFRLPLTVNALETWSMPAHPVMALGYAALIILIVREGGWLIDRLAAVGRAAFTNYLGTSILATIVFNGSGLGLYGQVSRAQSWLLVPIVWALMLLWSKPWLDRFTYGPFEWLWRSLARGRLQPMRKCAAVAA